MLQYAHQTSFLMKTDEKGSNEKAIFGNKHNTM